MWCDKQDKGLKYHVEMDESTPFIELLFQVSVPFTCPSCSLTIPIKQHTGLTVSSCALTFTADDIDMYKSLRVRAVQTAGRNARILQLKFGKIEAEGSLLDGFKIPNMRVCGNVLYSSAKSCKIMYEVSYAHSARKVDCVSK